MNAVFTRTLDFAMAIQEPTVLQTPQGLKYLPPAREAAWIGLLQAHSELTRALDAALSAKHGLSLSAYEVLSRLAHAEGGALRMSQLAERSQLSLSRVSRVIDMLQDRGLVERKSCATDSRVVYASITPIGTALVAQAQETFFAVIEERFLGRLSCDEVEQLGTLLGRLIEGRLGEQCPNAVEPPAS